MVHPSDADTEAFRASGNYIGGTFALSILRIKTFLEPFTEWI